MKRIEVIWEEKLKEGESILLDNHSFLNLLNVLEKQLASAQKATTCAQLRDYCDFCLDVLIDISSRDFSNKISVIEDKFRELTRIVKGLAEEHKDHRDLLEGLLETLDVALARTVEFKEGRYDWKYIRCQAIHANLSHFLTATEKYGRGRFHFVYTPRKAGKEEYEIDFKIEASGSELLCPPVLQDTIRDLVANSRKYSASESRIGIRLEEIRDRGLRLQVTDEGIGIPEDEIEKVVQYGFRASNVIDRRTMGGGFGLTKAYLLCKRFRGDFHIASKLGEGTTVELTLFPPT